MKLKRYINSLFNIYKFEDYTNEKIEFQYITQSMYPDFIRVYANNKFLFSYYYIDGVNSKLYSGLSKWHKSYMAEL